MWTPAPLPAPALLTARAGGLRADRGSGIKGQLGTGLLDRALAGTLASARQYRDQMKAFMTGSTDAIAHVQEGIVVDVNPAWADLFGHEEAAALLGQPLMDFFQQRSHAALKGALSPPDEELLRGAAERRLAALAGVTARP